jgi:hypothetical protein
MNNLNFAFILDTKNQKSYCVTDANQHVIDIFSHCGEFRGLAYFERYELTDSHGKPLKHLVEAQCNKIRRKRATKHIATGRKRSIRDSFRRIKTTQERRGICGAKAEGLENLIRGRRKTLPSYYDEQWRSDLNVRNWKSQRNKQYK